MKAYIGCKIILAEPKAKDGQEGYEVVYPDWYVSWSPKDVFETAYRLVQDNEVGLILEDEDPISLVDVVEEEDA
jgi:hypothetical protein